MHIEPVDERDSCWENPAPRFRVYRYRPDHLAQSWITITDDVTDADALEVIAWAREQAGAEQLYAVALVVDARRHAEHEERGLVWLVGEDLPHAYELTAKEQQTLAGMYARRAEYRAARDST